MPQQDDPLSLRLQAGHPEEAARAVHPASLALGIFEPRSHTRGKLLDPSLGRSCLSQAAGGKLLVASRRFAGSETAQQRNGAQRTAQQQTSAQERIGAQRTAQQSHRVWALSSGLRPLGSGFWALAARLWPPGSGSQALASGLWPLGSGLRALAHQRIGA